MDVLALVAAVLVVVVAAAVLQLFWPQSRTVAEYERGLRFRRGRLLGEVGPGRYWLWQRIDRLVTVDLRRRQLVVAGQEVLTSDRVPLKVSLVGDFTVTDVTRAVTEVESYADALYTALQLALREVLAQKDLEAALAERGEIGGAVTEAVRPVAAELGVTLVGAQVRDFMMAGGLRSAFSDVVQARQEGLAALERARGESAAVRNLANAAELIERHPGIAQLRLLQAVEKGSGNRIVIALDPERGRKATFEAAAESED